MPLERKVEFLAVDEIQMAADAERGHIFTDRLLHARGTRETMFLGAETIKPLLRLLLPEIEIETRPRFSKLSYTGIKKITRLPARSAIIGFSVQDVYALAELIRRQKGGAERGHIFTDRLLHARGTRETMFLGAETIKPLLRLLLPEIEIETRPRFSKLSYTGIKKITRLPARSAIIGFSVQDVYALAELIRRQKGGAAVVMGALSPRTRNARRKRRFDHGRRKNHAGQPVLFRLHRRSDAVGAQGRISGGRRNPDGG